MWKRLSSEDYVESMQSGPDGHPASAVELKKALSERDATRKKHDELAAQFVAASQQLAALQAIIEETVLGLAETGRWRIHPVGALDLLPDRTARMLKQAAESTADIDGILVNVAVGYGGRREVVDAVRSLLHEHAHQGTSVEDIAQMLDVEHIAEHLYTKGQPDPDLVIRTSGEQRLSGFLLWQSAHSEFYFCEAYWPNFRHVDFLRALRAYAARQRRFGT